MICIQESYENHFTQKYFNRPHTGRKYNFKGVISCLTASHIAVKMHA